MNLSNPFRRRPAALDPAPADAAGPSAEDLRVAYKRGGRDALRARKRHPLGMTFLFAAAAAGVAVVAYAVYAGSFGGGGERLDQDLAVAVQTAKPVVREAVSDAGQALKDAADPPASEPPASSTPR